MKKKIFSILLTSILAVTVLAGCGNSADTSTEKSVTITNVSYDPTRDYTVRTTNFSQSIGKGKQDRTLKLYSHTAAAVSKHLKLQTETRQTL